jgi:CTD small phosphatase-like protein 2
MTAYFAIRPYTQECLQTLSKHFELIAFTAGQKEYANAIISIIDPHNQYFDYVLTRENCIHLKENNLFIKDLRIIDRPLEKIAIVDNSIVSFFFQLANGWPIFAYDGDSKDQALVELTNFLVSCKDVADLREPLRNKFRLEELAQCNIDKFIDIVEIYEDNDDEYLEDIPMDQQAQLKRRKSAMIIDQNLDGIRDYISKIYKKD